jgi:hypothetical protein
MSGMSDRGRARCDKRAWDVIALWDWREDKGRVEATAVKGSRTFGHREQETHCSDDDKCSLGLHMRLSTRVPPARKRYGPAY